MDDQDADLVSLSQCSKEGFDCGWLSAKSTSTFREIIRIRCSNSHIGKIRDGDGAVKKIPVLGNLRRAAEVFSAPDLATVEAVTLKRIREIRKHCCLSPLLVVRQRKARSELRSRLAYQLR